MSKESSPGKASDSSGDMAMLNSGNHPIPCAMTVPPGTEQIIHPDRDVLCEFVVGMSLLGEWTMPDLARVTSP